MKKLKDIKGNILLRVSTSKYLTKYRIVKKEVWNARTKEYEARRYYLQASFLRIPFLWFTILDSAFFRQLLDERDDFKERIEHKDRYRVIGQGMEVIEILHGESE